MSKQSQAKEVQGYRIEGPRCGSCRHFESEMVPVPWMVQRNEELAAEGLSRPYDLTLSCNQNEKNLRCGKGGFAVKKTAYCKEWVSA